MSTQRPPRPRSPPIAVKAWEIGGQYDHPSEHLDEILEELREELGGWSR